MRESFAKFFIDEIAAAGVTGFANANETSFAANRYGDRDKATVRLLESFVGVVGDVAGQESGPWPLIPRSVPVTLPNKEMCPSRDQFLHTGLL